MSIVLIAHRKKIEMKNKIVASALLNVGVVGYVGRSDHMVAPASRSIEIDRPNI